MEQPTQQTIRAILIDSTLIHTKPENVVQEIRLPMVSESNDPDAGCAVELDAIYSALGCEIFSCPFYTAQGDVFYLDDDGIASGLLVEGEDDTPAMVSTSRLVEAVYDLMGTPKEERYYPEPAYMGRLLIIGDCDGESVDAKISLELVKEHIAFPLHAERMADNSLMLFVTGLPDASGNVKAYYVSLGDQDE